MEEEEKYQEKLLSEIENRKKTFQRVYLNRSINRKKLITEKIDRLTFVLKDRTEKDQYGKHLTPDERQIRDSYSRLTNGQRHNSVMNFRQLLCEAQIGLLEWLIDNQETLSSHDELIENHESPKKAILDVVEDILAIAEESFLGNDFELAKESLCEYFEGGKESSSAQIRVRNGSKTKLSKVLGKLHKSLKHKEAIDWSYLQFCVSKFDCFSDKDIKGKKHYQTNLCKAMQRNITRW